MTNRRRGGALLAVLWLSAALAAIAFSVATSVRGEAERASTLADSIRARYLAAGAIERVLPRLMVNLQRPMAPVMPVEFPGGVAMVEIIPETARLNLNRGRMEEFLALLLALGAAPDQAQMIAAAIVDWRSPGGQLDGYYLSLTPSFRPPHASFQETEEALWVRGMTPELFHGNWVRDAQGRLVRLGAFKDCVSVFGGMGTYDVNGVDPALLRAFGAPEEGIAAMMQLRRQRYLRSAGEVAPLVGPAAGRLRVIANTIFTLRASARPRLPGGGLSETRRAVSARVKFHQSGEIPPYDILRWDDNATAEEWLWQ